MSNSAVEQQGEEKYSLRHSIRVGAGMVKLPERTLVLGCAGQCLLQRDRRRKGGGLGPQRIGFLASGHSWRTELSRVLRQAGTQVRGAGIREAACLAPAASHRRAQTPYPRVCII
jgi:hypothetical protein